VAKPTSAFAASITTNPVLVYVLPVPKGALYKCFINAYGFAEFTISVGKVAVST